MLDKLMKFPFIYVKPKGKTFLCFESVNVRLNGNQQWKCYWNPIMNKVYCDRKQVVVMLEKAEFERLFEEVGNA